LGRVVSGRLGEWMVSSFIILELIGFVCIKTIYLWGHLDLSFSLLGWEISESSYIFFSTIFISLTFFKVNIQEFSFLNGVGSTASICLVFAIFIAFVFRNRLGRGESLNWFDIDGFGISSGIYVFAFSGHAVLPSVYMNMQEPSKFPNMIGWTFTGMFWTFCLTSFFGYALMLDETKDEITFSVAETGMTIIASFMALVVLIAVITSMCPVVAILCEIPEEYLGWSFSPNKQRTLRLSCYLVCVIVSYIARNSLASFMSIVGGFCTVWTSIILPIYFYTVLHEKSLPKWKVTVNKIACGIATFLSFVFTFQTLLDLVHTSSDTDSS